MRSNRVGIMGGGQLALMLADAATKMGLRPIILAEDASSPAALAHPEAIFGSSSDEETLEYFFSQVNQVIFENEFVDCELLKKVATGKGITFSPNLDVILQFQDKFEQKRILEKLNIPTAEYFLLNLEEGLEKGLFEAMTRLGGSCVLKWARMGYDGKGVLVLENSPESFRENLKKAKIFCEEARRKKSRIYAERKVEFKRELAMVAVHSVRGEFVSYPLVISEQKQGICFRVYGPANQLGISAEKEKLVEGFARKLAQSSGLLGTFAIELFETHEGELFVNEIAPRVHNSGHYTQNACATDQFENHCRAALGLPLGAPLPRPCFAMLNLLGPENGIQLKEEFFSSLPLRASRTHLHWYHKKEIRPGRKLGHLNGVADSVKELDSLLNELAECHLNWVHSLAQPGRG